MPGRSVIIRSRSDGVRPSAELKKSVEKAIRAALKHEKVSFPTEISLSYVTDERIKELNSEYRGIDRPTDVLSFPEYQDRGEAERDGAENRVPLGDIVISLERAEAQSREYGHSLTREACFLAVHSVLHLLGYDHERSEEEEREMFEKQETILSEAGFARETPESQNK